MEKSAPTTKRSHRWRRRIAIGLALAFAVSPLACWLVLRRPVEATVIYRGVVYSCQTMPESDESGGLVHLIRVDLAAPGVGLYFTPSAAPGVAVHHLEWTSSCPARKPCCGGERGAVQRAQQVGRCPASNAAVWRR
ncbi:MAG: hypothetical protein ACLPSO_16850 [Terracidiphilus sp.]